MLRKYCLAAALMLAGPSALGAQLLEDINAVPRYVSSESSSFPDGVTVANGTLFMLADFQHGTELWITDGAAGGTHLVRDIQPGPISSNISRMTLVAGIAMFFADDGANGVELWRSDGTAQGTTLVANIGAGAAPFHPFYPDDYGPMANIGMVAYFRAKDASGEELWRSDGTATGTYRVADIAPGAADAHVQAITAVGSRLYFLATDAAGEELWTSDGTPAGTVRVADIGPGAANAEIGSMTVAGGRLFFVANDVVHGREVWRTTASGTGAEVVDLNTVAEATDPSRNRSSMPGGMFALGDSVVFGAITMTGTAANPQSENALYRLGASGPAIKLITRPAGAYPQNSLVAGTRAIVALGFLDLYVTDGTAAGTTPLGIGNLYVQFDHAVLKDGNVSYFYAQLNPGSENPGYDLWRTDGTAAGTRLYADLDAVSPSEELVAFNGRPYFVNSYIASPNLHVEVWTSDGTPAGTQRVSASGSGVSGLLVGAGRLFYTALDADFSFDPWVTDGTSAGSQRLRDLQPQNETLGSGVEIMGSLGTTVLFSADDGVHGPELWATDGTSANTRMVRDIVPGAEGSGVTGLVAMNGFALLSADDGIHGHELWRTDGTEAGTYMVKDIHPGAIQSIGAMTPMYSARLGGFVYFVAEDGVNGMEVWRTDGTAAGTTRVSNLIPGISGFVYLLPQVVNGRLFVIAQAQAGSTMWSGDGSGAPFVSLTSTALPEGIDTAAVYQGELCWLGFGPTFDSEIYCSNGAAGSVHAVTDFIARGLDAIGPVFPVNGRLLVDVYGGNTTNGGLYSSDGTIASLQKISDLHFGGSGVYLDAGTRYVAHVGSLYSGNDLMVTDGTAAGTRLFLPPNAPPASRVVLESLGTFDDFAVFGVNDPVRGQVIWKSDGTAAGTRFVADLNPRDDDLGGEAPGGFFQNGARLFFHGHRAWMGSELWMMSAANPNATDDVAQTAFNTAVSVDVLANDAVFDGSLSTASVEIVTAPVSGTTSINAATGAITYTPNAGFAGLDTFTYRVGNGAGAASNVASVEVTTMAQVLSATPGTAPLPPPVPPPVTPPATPPSSGGGGGGGALGTELLVLMLLAALAGMRARRKSH